MQAFSYQTYILVGCKHEMNNLNSQIYPANALR